METTILKIVVALNDEELKKFLKITPDAYGTELEKERLELATNSYFTNKIVLSPLGLADLILYLTK